MFFKLDLLTLNLCTFFFLGLVVWGNAKWSGSPIDATWVISLSLLDVRWS
jgi:hypothetical protein